MDDETISVLKTVCVAGGARSGYSEESNARLEELVDAGFLTETDEPDPSPYRALHHRFYRPTKKGVTLVQKLKETGVA